jgi:hypothetical protein
MSDNRGGKMTPDDVQAFCEEEEADAIRKGYYEDEQTEPDWV